MEATNPAEGIVVFLVLLSGGSLLVTVTAPMESRTTQVRLFVLGMVLRFLWSVALYEFGLTRIIGDEDSSGWVIGVGLRDKWVASGVTFLNFPSIWIDAYQSGRHFGYYYLLGMVFYALGSASRLVAGAVNCFIGAWVIVFAYRISRSLFSPWVATRVGWLTCIWPSLILWSAMTIKEPVVILLEMWALDLCVRLTKRQSVMTALVTVPVLAVVLIPFRYYASYVVFLGLLASVGQLLLGRFFRQLPVSVTLVLILFMLGSSLFVARAQVETDAIIEKAEIFRENVSSGGEATGARSGVKTEDIRTPEGLVVGTSIGFAHLMLAPFPWQLGGGSLRMALTLPELLVWWVLFFWGLLPGLNLAVRRHSPGITVVLVYLIGFAVIYSLAFGNIGLVFRQRAQLLPLLFNFALLGLEGRWSSPRRGVKPRLLHPVVGGGAGAFGPSSPAPDNGGVA